MKANLSKMLRSVLSLVLALSLVVGLCPAVFATETPTDDLSNIDWNSDLSNYDWDNVAWDKVDLTKIDYDKVPYDKVDYDKIDYTQIAWDKLNYDKVDYEKINYDKIDYSKIEYGKIDYDKIDYDKINYDEIEWDKVDVSQIDITKVPLEKVDLSKVDLNKTNLMANLSMRQLAALIRNNPSFAYATAYDVLDNKGYVDKALAAMDKLEAAIDAAAAKAATIEKAPEALSVALKNAKTAVAKLRELMQKDTLSRADLLGVYEDLRKNVLTVVDFAADKAPETVTTLVKDAAMGVYLAWEIFLDERVPAMLEVIVRTTKNIATEHKEAILAAGTGLAAFIVKNADKLDPILPEGIKANTLKIVDLLKAGQERAAIGVAMDIIRDTIDAVRASDKLNKQTAMQLLEKTKELAATIKAAIYARYIEATRDFYTVDYASSYVALGDASVVENSYANLIAEELHMNYTNLADANLKTVGETFNTIAANAATIAAADLITIGYDNNTFALNAVNQNVTFDWAGHIGETGAQAVATALNDIKNYLLNDLGASAEETVAMVGAIEAYAYSAGSYAWNMPQLVKAIREINEDAVVVLVGMYNPLENMTVQVKGKTLEVGHYVDYLVDLVGAQGLAYAMLTMDCIYVDAPAVETEYEAAGLPNVLDAVAMIDYVATQGAAMRASAAGDEYIKTQILNALTINYEGVHRVYGETRFETAIAVAEEMKHLNNVEKFETMIITSGEKFPDALAGTYLATTKNAPILLSLLDEGNRERGRKYDQQTADYVAANLAENGIVYILGGEKAVSDEMEGMLTANGVKAENIVRLYGDNRFETNLAILEELGVDGKEILVCTGTVFADTLSASATGLPILLVHNENGALYDYQEEFLAGLNGNAVSILGGNAAVSDELQAEIAEVAGVTVDRVVGEGETTNRIDTAMAVAAKYFPNATQMVLATGWEFADALAGGSMAATLEAPIILTVGPRYDKGYEYSLNYDYGTYVYENYTSVQNVNKGIVLGGYADRVIPDALANAAFGRPADAYIFAKLTPSAVK